MTDSTLNLEINSDRARKDSDKLTKSLDKLELQGNDTSKSLKRTGDEARKSGNGFNFLKGAVAAVFTTSALAGFTQTLATFESLQNSLGVVFQSMETGKAVFRDIQELAATTPFTVEAFTESVVKLRAAGIEPTIEQLTLFSDTASVTGDAIGSLSAITDLFARTTAGGLGLEDLNRLMDRGIPVYTIVKEKLGLARLEISELGKTAEGANKILTALTEGLNERFGGASADAANLLRTSISNAGDAWDRFLVAIGDSGALGLATEAVQGVTAAISWMAQNLDTVAVAASGLATLVIPSLIAGVKALTLAIAANPIGALVVGITAGVTALYHFRDVLYDAAIRTLEVTLPNAADSAQIAFLSVKASIYDMLNGVLQSINEFGNNLVAKTPDWLKGMLGIDGQVFSLGIDVASVEREIGALEEAISNRLANFTQPDRPDFFNKGDGSEGSSLDDGQGIGSGGLTGNLLGGAPTTSPEATDELNEQRRSQLEKQLEQTQTYLLTEEERLLQSYMNRQAIVEEAYTQELVSEERKNEILLGLREKHEKSMDKLLQKKATEREKFMAMSYKSQTKTVLGELINLTSGVAQQSRTMFEINKAAGIANALINTYEGVTKSLSAYPQPLAGVMAGIHFAAGMAQVNAIKNQSFNGGGVGSSPAGATGGAGSTLGDSIVPAQPIQDLQEDEQTGRVINVYLDGVALGDDNVRELVVDAIETAEANDEIRFQSNGF